MKFWSVGGKSKFFSSCETGVLLTGFAEIVPHRGSKEDFITSKALSEFISVSNEILVLFNLL
ncbi:MAG: hypothetical protein ACD_79C01094G0001 [uncultured bacterium]|nr:MAG: hypothetical protein ACD_79C01094G0001 [uncultured bacterium]